MWAQAPVEGKAEAWALWGLLLPHLNPLKCGAISPMAMPPREGASSYPIPLRYIIGHEAVPPLPLWSGYTGLSLLWQTPGGEGHAGPPALRWHPGLASTCPPTMLLAGGTGLDKTIIKITHFLSRTTYLLIARRETVNFKAASMRSELWNLLPSQRPGRPRTTL